MTVRAFVLGLGLTTLVNLLPAYSAYIVHSSRMVFGHLPMATMVVFTLVAWPLNIALAGIRPRWAFGRGEMVVAFSMMWIAGTVPAANFVGLFIGGIAAPYYYASAENRWDEYLTGYLPRWAVPTNANGQMAWFFEGKPPEAAIPWEAWIGPLAWWGSFLLALALVSAAVMAVLRQQWVLRERLPFPLAEAPLMMTEEDSGVGDYPLLRSRLFWVGVLLPLTVIVWNIGGYFWHTVPPFPVLQGRYLPLARGFPGIHIKLNPFVLGFLYFTHLDILFSLWFWYLVGIVQTGVFERLGYTIGDSDIWGSYGGAAMGWQAMGAFTAYTLVGLWMARGHFAQVWRKAVHGDPGVDDGDELVSYRTALLFASVGLVYLYLWLWRSGMSPPVAGVFLFALVLMTVGVSRFVAESGLSYARMPIMPQTFTLYTIGISGMDMPSAAALGVSYCHFGLGNTFGASALAHIARIGAELRLRTRSLFRVTAIALAFSLVVSVVFTLHLGYKHGAYNFNVYTFSSGNVYMFSNIVQKLQNPFGPSTGRLGFLGIGILVSGICTFLRHRFLWWPVSPIGLTVFTTGTMRRQAFTAFVAWAFKGLILRVGGIALYRRTQPLFMGLLLGYVAGIGLVFVVDAVFFMGNGHLLHLW